MVDVLCYFLDGWGQEIMNDMSIAWGTSTVKWIGGDTKYTILVILCLGTFYQVDQVCDFDRLKKMCRIHRGKWWRRLHSGELKDPVWGGGLGHRKRGSPQY